LSLTVLGKLWHTSLVLNIRLLKQTKNE